MLYLNNRDVAGLLTHQICIEGLEEAFQALARGRAVSRPRTDVRVPCARSDSYYRWGSMEGAIEPWGLFVTRMKSDIVSWTEHGTEELHCVEPGTFSGFVMVFSTRNGEPLAIMNDGILHHYRVAAGAALGVRYLARRDASVVGILGSGGMARSYLPAFCQVRKISSARVYSPSRAHRESYVRDLERELAIPLECCHHPREVVRGADIVATCTDATEAVLTDPSWIEPGTHLTNVNSKEWGREVVGGCDQVFQVGTETIGAGLAGQGNERQYGWATWMIGGPEETAHVPKRKISNLDFLEYPCLVDLLQDPSIGRTSAEQVTFFHNLGLLGFQFAAVAGLAYRLAVESGVGKSMSPEPFLQDIRD